MKTETTTKRILLLLTILFVGILLVGFTTFRSSPSVETVASIATSTSTVSIPETLADWDTIPPTTAPPVTVGKKISPKPSSSRPTKPRVSRSQGPGCTTGSATPYAPNANCSGCESRGTQTWNPSGEYWGKYQYGKEDWVANGGRPEDYGHASEAEQDRVAANTHYDAWPNC